MQKKVQKSLVYSFSALVLVGASWLLWSNFAVKLNQDDCAVVLRLGEITKSLNQPGTYFIIPVIDTLKSMPKYHTFDVRAMTGETRTIRVTVVDPQKFYLTINGNHDILERRIAEILKNYQRQGGLLNNFTETFNEGDFMDSGVRLDTG